jgi:hypothetical protein
MGIELKPEDVGRKVLYHSPGGETIEEGIIASINYSYVFVRFGTQQTPKACHRSNLEFVVG